MSLFGSSSHASAPPPGISALSLQQSSYSTPIPVIYGTNRISGNMLWYGAFTQTLVSTGGGGGKGGVVGGGGKGGGSSEYQYSASFAIGICEGPISGVGQTWISKQVSTIPGIGGSLFIGALDQSPWGYLATNFPTQADGYNKTAYMGLPNFSLGTSAETPQFSFEVSGIGTGGAGGQDATVDQVIIDWLTRCGIPATYIDTYTDFATYCQASGFFISPVADQQRQGNDWLNEWMGTLNAEFVFTNGKLTIVPRGDAPISGNGANYIPNLQPIYNIGDDDYIVDGDEDPVTVNISDMQDAYNQMPIEFCNRGDQYNLETFVAEDQGSIEQFGRRPAPTLIAHHITDPTMAQNMAYIALWKQAYIDHGPTYTFKLPWNFFLLDPMDLISITDTQQGIIQKLVRVRSIKENDVGVLEFVCEDMPGDIATPAIYNMVTPSKYTANYGLTPDSINDPVFIELPLGLIQKAAIEIAIGISGAGPNWGGTNVWVSTDGDVYQFLAQVNGSNRMGKLTALLANYTIPPGGNNVDTTHTLSIDMTESRGQFQNSAVNNDAISYNTLSYVDGEFISFGHDVLTDTYKYNLSYIYRGAYGSTIAAHAIGTNFVRIDQSVPRYDTDQTRVGQTLYFKFLSFNQWGGGLQKLSDVPAYSYLVLGTALLTPLDNPANVSVSYLDNIGQINWTPISDVRSPIFYEIRKGGEFNSAQVVGTTTQNSFAVYGSDTYWITALYFTPTGTPVYSTAPASIAITTPSLQQYLIEEWDESSTGWSGTCTGAAVLISGNIEVSGSGNILDDPSFLDIPNLLDYAAGAGTYTAPSGHTITSNYLIDAKVILNWTVSAVDISASDVTSFADITTVADVTGGVSSAFVTAQPQIRLSTNGGSTYGDWINWVPGVYTFNAIQYRIILQSLSLGVTAILSQFSIDVDVPLRTDSGTDTSSALGVNTINYPGGEYNFTPIVHITIINAQAGDLVVLTAIGLTSFTYEIINAGVNVARSVNWTAQGY